MNFNSVIIYGAGRTGQRVYSFLKNLNISVLGFVDNNLNSDSQGLPLWDVNSIPQQFKKSTTILALHNEVQKVYSMLVENGFSDVITMGEMNLYCENRFEAYLEHGPLGSYSQILENEETIREVESWLSDDISHDIFRSFVNYRKTGKIKFLRNADSGPMYFSDNVPFQFTQPVTFVDCGTFIGDTIEILQTRVQLKQVFAFEPDLKTYDILSHNIQTNLHGINIVAIPMGVSNTNEVLSFSTAQDGSANISSAGDSQIMTVKMDDFFHGTTVDWVKMDIEGAEASALQGMQRLIREQNPLLAVSIYHKPTDFWELITLIHNLAPHTSLFLRSHNDSFHDTVCYAVPERFMLK